MVAFLSWHARLTFIQSLNFAFLYNDVLILFTGIFLVSIVYFCFIFSDVINMKQLISSVKNHNNKGEEVVV